MGCWNQTCMCTNLPVLYGEKCMIALIIESPYDSSGCYASDQYVPVLLLHGDYDDYGGIEDVTSKERLPFLEHIAPFSRNNDGTYEPYKIHELSDFLHEASLNRLYVRQQGISKEGREFCHIRTVCLKKGVLDMAKQNLNDTADDNDNWLPNMESDLDSPGAATFIKNMLVTSLPNPYARNFFGKTLKTDRAAAIENAKELIAVNYLLTDLRKSWHIPSGGGDQSSLCDAQNLFLNFYREALDAIRYEYDD